MRYVAVVSKDEDSCYGVHFPAVAGCYSAGDTYEEAVSNAKRDLRLYLDELRNCDYPVPDPCEDNDECFMVDV